MQRLNAYIYKENPTFDDWQYVFGLARPGSTIAGSYEYSSLLIIVINLIFVFAFMHWLS